MAKHIHIHIGKKTADANMRRRPDVLQGMRAALDDANGECRSQYANAPALSGEDATIMRDRGGKILELLAKALRLCEG